VARDRAGGEDLEGQRGRAVLEELLEVGVVHRHGEGALGVGDGEGDEIGGLGLGVEGLDTEGGDAAVGGLIDDTAEETVGGHGNLTPGTRQQMTSRICSLSSSAQTGHNV
jgi:hypothetical protein